MHNSVLERLSSPSYEKAPPFSPSADVFNILLKSTPEIKAPNLALDRAGIVAQAVSSLKVLAEAKFAQIGHKKDKKSQVKSPASASSNLSSYPVLSRESITEFIIISFYKKCVDQLNKTVKNASKEKCIVGIVLNYLENPEFTTIIDQIENLLVDSELSHKNQLIWVSDYLIPKFIEFNKDVINAISAMVKLSDSPELKLPQFKKMTSELWDYIRKKTLEYNLSRAKDTRQIKNHDRQLRRVDSLARLLSPDSKYTPCIAVTIDEGEIILSSNLNSSANPVEVVEVLKKKLFIIRQYFTEMNLDNPEQPLFKPGVTIESIAKLMTERKELYLLDLKSIIDENFYQKTMNLIRDLKANGGVFHPDHVLFQAAIKVLTALRTEESFLSSPKLLNLDLLSNTSIDYIESILQNESDRPIFSGNYRSVIMGNLVTTILVPSQSKQDAHLGMILTSSNNGSAFNQKDITFSSLPHAPKINHLHAEQLSAYYILLLREQDKTAQLSSRIRVGIPKLCCFDCNEELSKHTTFMFSGTSGVKFKDTVFLLSLSPSVSPVSVFPSVASCAEDVSATHVSMTEHCKLERKFEASTATVATSCAEDVSPDPVSMTGFSTPIKQLDHSDVSTPCLKHSNVPFTSSNPSPFFTAEKGDGDSKTTRGRHFSPKSLFFN